MLSTSGKTFSTVQDILTLRLDMSMMVKLVGVGGGSERKEEIIQRMSTKITSHHFIETVPIPQMVTSTRKFEVPKALVA